MKKTKGLNVRKAYLTLLVLLLSIVLVACGGNSSAKDDNTKDATKDKAEEEKFVLKLNSATGPSTSDSESKYFAVERFAELVKERTDGRVTIELYYNNQLAGQSESLDALARGTIDIQDITPQVWSDKIPEAAFFGLPFSAMGEEHIQYILRETEVGKIYEQALENYGVKLLMYWPVSSSGYLSKNPIRSTKDFNGIVYNNQANVQFDFYTSMGAGITGIPLAEYYEGFLRGTIDATIFPYYTIEKLKLHEVIDYMTITPVLNPGVNQLAINQTVWDKLPTDIQDIMMETVQEMEIEAAKASQKMTEDAFEFAKENNVELIKLTEESYNEFVQLGKEKVWSKFEAQNDNSKKMIEVLNTETEKWITENPEAKEIFDKKYLE